MLNSDEGDMTKTIHSFKSVWDALANTPEQAANLRARSGLMRQITEVIEENGWTQMEAGAKYGAHSRGSMISFADESPVFHWMHS